jgi:hypothetical protein
MRRGTVLSLNRLGVVRIRWLWLNIVGTSLAMIEQDYCGTLGLRLGQPVQGDRTVFEPQAPKYAERLVAGPGFEPGTSRL